MVFKATILAICTVPPFLVCNLCLAHPSTPGFAGNLLASVLPRLLRALTSSPSSRRVLFRYSPVAVSLSLNVTHIPLHLPTPDAGRQPPGWHTIRWGWWRPSSDSAQSLKRLAAIRWPRHVRHHEHQPVDMSSLDVFKPQILG